MGISNTCFSRIAASPKLSFLPVRSRLVLQQSQLRRSLNPGDPFEAASQHDYPNLSPDAALHELLVGN